MKLTILNIKEIIFESEVKSVNLKTQAGELTIMDNHRPLVSLLAKGEASILRNDGKEELISINSGFLEMSPQNTLTLLVD